jgi:hypothetical protein
MNDTPAKRFIQAFGTNDPGLLDEIYADDVVLYSPIGTPDPAPEILSAGGSEHQR